MIFKERNDLLSSLLNLKLKTFQYSIEEPIKSIIDRNLTSIEKQIKRIKVVNIE